MDRLSAATASSSDALLSTLPDRTAVTVGRELVAAGCHTSALFDLVEEPLDQVASTAKGAG
jgi:hypothetical protein